MQAFTVCVRSAAKFGAVGAFHAGSAGKKTTDAAWAPTRLHAMLARRPWRLTIGPDALRYDIVCLYVFHECHVRDLFVIAIGRSDFRIGMTAFS